VNFNSPEFLFFFPAVLVLFGLTYRNATARNLLFLGSSYFFYMSWNWKYAGLIAISTLVDYGVGLALDRRSQPRMRRALVSVSLVVNLGLLGFFKYYGFFTSSLVEGASFLGLDLSIARYDFLLPVGISFYTFQTLSYTLDLYRREIPVERSLLRFAVFVSFFPQLVAGPIVRAKNFLPQLRREPCVTDDRVSRGFALIFRGLVKKVLIADLLAGLAVDSVFADPSLFSSWDLVFALYGYAFQIYYDFSGYSDIAIGAALVMGFELPENFRRPYLSQNVREFWTRWHISLSTWLRDYLYISLGGNRSGALRMRVNLFLTMLLGGLWHGAAWNFVLWGAYHGILLILAGRQAERAPDRRGFDRIWRQFGTFHLVVFGWLLFRVHSMVDFSSYVEGIMSGTTGTQLSPPYYLILFVGALAHVLPREGAARTLTWIARSPVPVQAGVYAVLLLAFCGATIGAPAFIYFQF
jgi:D-alanyl-lipoteichoic acid acyltransferase DltB (MBOAT superfamily)